METPFALRYAMCDFPETPAKTALSQWEREPERAESSSRWREGLGGFAPLREEGKSVAHRILSFTLQFSLCSQIIVSVANSL